MRKNIATNGAKNIASKIKKSIKSSLNFSQVPLSSVSRARGNLGGLTKKGRKVFAMRIIF
jgi:ribosomal protein L30E